MYAALSSRGILVYANQATMEGKYYCPDCRQRVQLIQGTGQQAHFRHQSRNRRLAGAESDQHKQAKAFQRPMLVGTAIITAWNTL
ncbi:competence protein CoiA family protein [Facklamia hominis]|uniref:competence protein CoiA family protein n=1 Tax=Facklamia hominis TaxID=178214 RepID=UPI0029D415C4|nr:competence protein CoiA family protein [Facklamia hominis]WPJ90436.1 competence protein CoiA family protein [Facklamia hominis]